MTVPVAPLTLRWYLTFLRVRLVGEAFNVVVPAGGFGGEPVKAVLLKSHYGISFHDSSPGIVLTRIAALVGQFAFVCAILVVMATATRMPDNIQTGAWAALVMLAAMTASFVLLPKLKLSSRLSRRAQGTRWGAFLAKGLAGIEAVEDRVNAFAHQHPARYWGSIALSFLRWALGAGEMWLALHLLGHPVTVVEALVLEGLLQLTRTVSFFVPANLGTQDGALALCAAALTGSPAAGLGAALLRRVRELLIVALGLSLGSHYSLKSLRRTARGQAPEPAPVPAPASPPARD